MSSRVNEVNGENLQDPQSKILATPMIPVEFRGDLWRQKTRVPGLSYDVVYVILRLAVLVEL